MLRQVKLLISCAYWALAQVGGALGALVGARGGPRLVILYYHSVRERDRARFAAQMDRLRRLAEVVPCWAKEAPPGARRLAAVTFDDAFVNVVENALPELARRNLHCTIFVPAAVIGQNPGWAMESDGDQNELVVDRDVLRALPGPLVAIGAHSMTHPFLTRIGADKARWEIAGSKAVLEEIIGKDVTLFAFPYGDHDGTILGLCREAGYEHAFSVVPRPVRIDDRALLRGRVSVEPTDGALEFFLKASGGYAWMPLASRLKAMLRGSRASRPAAASEQMA
jgi:peptidoglycan/xylan/chitin deacetylase (PgdA/CDA1 family)